MKGVLQLHVLAATSKKNNAGANREPVVVF
jgi:hypothetical protein